MILRLHLGWKMPARTLKPVQPDKQLAPAQCSEKVRLGRKIQDFGQLEDYQPTLEPFISPELRTLMVWVAV